MLAAVRPVVIGLLVWTAYDMAASVFGAGKFGSRTAMLKGWDKAIIAIAACTLLIATRINPVFLVLGAAALVSLFINKQAVRDPLPFFHRQRDTFQFRFGLEDPDRHDLTDPDDLPRVGDVTVGQLGNMDEAVLVDADVDEGAEVRDVGHDALQPHAGHEVGNLLDRLGEKRAT